ncbi:putative kinase related to galactokinase and mevalonate kinase [Tritrichomonas foetus]|uniref:Kinase related to galactokinase and mevalonate kinase n=1 Tax=Tritrichomonas foetus TaxID=1144522 RepID=A0A1J4KLP8_9EUKA|nr:putative kinase related to galactokinase and mevalonate kinase [Tritrichomonas foetus]|eukprot:OHT11864.1 putative kinase related to galactokinase and mevalonate kinase [Tritrichomonas foetus]
MILLAVLPERFSGGMFVLSGDVLLLFNPLQISISNSYATAISTKAPLSVGIDHGVFLSDSDNKVTEFLHKLTAEKLQEKGAVNKLGNVDLDTGMIWLSATIIDSIWKLVSTNNEVVPDKFNLFVSEQSRLNFYGDFLFPLASGATLEQYLAEAPEFQINDELIECRKQLWASLHNYTIDVKKLSPAKFIHFGTTAELRSLMTDELNEYKFLEWRPNVLTNLPADSPFTGINSYVSPKSTVGKGTFIEDANIKTNCTIGENCVISNVNLETMDITLADNTVLHVLPIIGNKFCARIFHVRDNPKKSMYFRQELTPILDHYGISEDQIYGNSSDHSFWNAALFPICDSVKESLQFAMFLQKFANKEATKEEVDKWLKTERISLTFDRADTGRIIEWQKALEDQVRVERFCEKIANDVPLQMAQKVLGSGSALQRELNRINNIAKVSNISMKMKLCKAISKLIPNTYTVAGLNSAQFEDLCYNEMRNETYRVHSSLQLSEGEPCERKKETVVSLPVRVNWGGGWSDTPPYCYDFGGAVLNAAITLQGEKPVRATAKIIPQKVVQFESKDFKETSEITNVKEIFNCANPFDSFALHKASLVVSGLIDENRPLEEQLNELGGGVYLCTHVDVPKGSGLGTSSILAGACLQALADLRGRKFSPSELCDQVLCVEQLMSTGGGWQDQIGGIINGIKLIKSKPGVVQVMKTEEVPISKEALNELNERFVLIYTGQQRLARNILREIVGKVLMREQRTMEILDQIQKLAVEMSFELERGRITEFAKLLNVHWELSKELDPGTTNTCIDYIFSCCEDMIDGKFICGAGGGGFLQVILKKGVTKAALSARLEKVFQESGVKVYDTQLI